MEENFHSSNFKKVKIRSSTNEGQRLFFFNSRKSQKKGGLLNKTKRIKFSPKRAKLTKFLPASFIEWLNRYD